MKTKNISRAAILVALAVALSPFFIPVGISKCYPAQHMINVIAAVVLRPAYAVMIAFCAALIRTIFGLGTLLAVPGGMIGALLAGLAYRAFRNTWAAGQSDRQAPGPNRWRWRQSKGMGDTGNSGLRARADPER